MSRELKEMTLETIALGAVVEEGNKALAEAISHCMRNPSIKKPRVVKIEIHVEPEIHEGTGEFAVNLTHFAVPVLPKTWGRADRAVRKDGEFKVVGNAQLGTLETNQINIAEHIDKKEREAKA